MKKLLLTCAVAATASFAGFAEDYNFGYALTDEVVSLSAGAPCYGEAIKIPADIQAAYGENVTIKALNLGFGSYPTDPTKPRSVELFIAEELNGTTLYTQTAELTPDSYTLVTLDTPFALSGKDIYVGFTVAGCGKNDGPIAVDYSLYDLPESYISVGSTLPQLASGWMTLQGQGFGNAALKAVLETPSQVNDFLYPMMSLFPNYTGEDTSFIVSTIARNFGSNEITSFGIESKVGNDEAETKEYNELEQFVGGATGMLNVDVAAGAPGKNLDVTVKFNTVNGRPNAYVGAVSTGVIDVLANGTFVPRTVVIEEGTGTDCGFCPRGYVGMEEMRKKYTDGTFIGICAHTYSSGDPMYCSSYRNICSQIYGSSYPTAAVNRMVQFDPSPDMCQQAYNLVHEDYYAHQVVEIKALYSSEAYAELQVMPTITSLVDENSHKLGLAIVTTEDELGPYLQANNYSGGRLGEMGGFENMGIYAEIVFNDVARTIVNGLGDTSVVPAVLEANVPTECGMIKISTANIADLKNGYVSALLIDTATGEIVNAVRINLPEAVSSNVDPAGVEGIAADVEGVEYFTLDGMRVNSDVLTPGLYLKREAGKTTKVIVK